MRWPRMVRIPGWNGSTGPTIYGQTLQKAAADSDQALRVSAQFFDVSQVRLMDFMGSSAHYLNLMQTPVFFWVRLPVVPGLPGAVFLVFPGRDDLIAAVLRRNGNIPT
ncbi:MAG: hypothetical protein WDN06_18470 [Asticcacaulis sp.]